MGMGQVEACGNTELGVWGIYYGGVNDEFFGALQTK